MELKNNKYRLESGVHSEMWKDLIFFPTGDRIYRDVMAENGTKYMIIIYYIIVIVYSTSVKSQTITFLLTFANNLLHIFVHIGPHCSYSIL